VALVYAGVLALWFGNRTRIGPIGFYLLFALTVTMSVQLVGLYLVFATLIVPPLATRRMTRYRLTAAWLLGALGYALGLAASTALDLPSGPVIVWLLVALGLLWNGLAPKAFGKPLIEHVAVGESARR
jgi:zinc/manganese transport system permease protein